MYDYQMFKTVLVKGFDKDEVLAYVQKMEEDANAEQSGLEKEIKELDAQVEELKKRITLKDEQRERLEADVEQKYKKYIDNYDSIARLVYEAQIKADQIVAEAQAKADDMIANADKIAQDKVDSVQGEINEKLSEGKKKYIAVQEEMNEIVELINQAQRRFMTSYKEVHHIIKTMPESLRELDEGVVDDDDDLDNAFDDTDELPIVGESIEVVFDDEDEE